MFLERLAIKYLSQQQRVISREVAKRMRTDDRETFAPLPALGHSFREMWGVVKTETRSLP